jgi:ABC-type sugar transport system permease subunit
MYFRIAEGEFGYASAIGAVLFIIVFAGTLVLVGNRRFSLALAND